MSYVVSEPLNGNVQRIFLLPSAVWRLQIQDPTVNKGTGFTYPERDRLRIRGLVPPRQLPMDTQAQKVRRAGTIDRTTTFFAALNCRRFFYCAYKWFIQFSCLVLSRRCGTRSTGSPT